MNHPSLVKLGLLRSFGRDGIEVSPRWTCDHAVLVECSLSDLEFEDMLDEDDDSGLEIVFEPDFSLDGDDEDDGEREVFVIFEPDDDDDDDEEDDWPP